MTPIARPRWAGAPTFAGVGATIRRTKSASWRIPSTLWQ